MWPNLRAAWPRRATRREDGRSASRRSCWGPTWSARSVTTEPCHGSEPAPGRPASHSSCRAPCAATPSTTAFSHNPRLARLRKRDRSRRRVGWRGHTSESARISEIKCCVCARRCRGADIVRPRRQLGREHERVGAGAGWPFERDEVAKHPLDVGARAAVGVGQCAASIGYSLYPNAPHGVRRKALLPGEPLCDCLLARVTHRRFTCQGQTPDARPRQSTPRS